MKGFAGVCASITAQTHTHVESLEDPVCNTGVDDGECDGRISVNGHLLGVGFDLTPGDCLPDLCSGQGSVELLCGGQVDAVVESSAELVPPDGVVLGDSSSDEDSSGVLGPHGHLGQHLLVSEEVDPEFPVGLVVHPELASEGSVGDTGDDDGDTVLVALVQEGVLVVQPGTDLVDDLVGGHVELLCEDLVEHGEEFVLEDLSVACVGNQDVSEPADLVLVPELRIVHLEVSLVVLGEGPRQVVVEGSAGGDDEVDTSGLVPKTGATMEGALVAQTNANYTTRQMRNVIYLAEGATVPTTQNGDLVLFYK